VTAQPLYGYNGDEVLTDMHSSGGRPQDLMPNQICSIKELFENPDVGLFYFAREVFEFRDLKPELHGPICRILGHWGETHMTDGRILTPEQLPGDGKIAQSFRRIMIRIPRECFKTSLATRANALLTVSKNSERTVGIFNEKESNSVSWIGAVCNVVEGSILYQLVYEDLIPKGIGFWDKDKGASKSRNLKWGGSGFCLNRNSHGTAELTMEPAGIGGAHAGKHYTHKILDDIIGLAAKDSDAVMKSAREWIDVSRPLERPAENGCELVCHTRWSYADVYTYMEEKWPGEYLIHQRSLLENPVTGLADVVNGESIFPEKITTAQAKRMALNDPFTFASQYQNEPRSGKGQDFEPDWMGWCGLYYDDQEPTIRFHHTGGKLVEHVVAGTYHDHLQTGTATTLQGHFSNQIFDRECGEDWAPQDVPLYYCSKAVILDPAPGKQTETARNPKARNGIVVVAIDPWGRRVCLEAREESCTPTELLRILVRLCRKWHTSTIAIEEVNFSAVYAPLFNQIICLEEEYRGFHPEWRRAAPKGRDKHERIRQGLIPHHREGYWYYNCRDLEEMAGPTGLVRKELREFPHGATIDLLDALAYTDEIITHRPETPDEAWRIKRRQRREDADRGLTGYGF
jgi:hypothetical protein